MEYRLRYSSISSLSPYAANPIGAALHSRFARIHFCAPLDEELHDAEGVGARRLVQNAILVRSLNLERHAEIEQLRNDVGAIAARCREDRPRRPQILRVFLQPPAHLVAIEAHARGDERLFAVQDCN